jgi:hypothetical protein
VLVLFRLGQLCPGVVSLLKAMQAPVGSVEPRRQNLSRGRHGCVFEDAERDVTGSGAARHGLAMSVEAWSHGAWTALSVGEHAFSRTRSGVNTGVSRLRHGNDG